MQVRGLHKHVLDTSEVEYSYFVDSKAEQDDNISRGSNVQAHHNSPDSVLFGGHRAACKTLRQPCPREHRRKKRFLIRLPRRLPESEKEEPGSVCRSSSVFSP